MTPQRAFPRSLLWLFAVASYLLVLLASIGQPLLPLEFENPFRSASLRGAFSAIIAPQAAASTSSGLRVVSSLAAASSVARTPAADLWSLAATAIWAAGAALSCLRIVLGRLQLRGELGIRSRVALVMEERCACPSPGAHGTRPSCSRRP